MLRKIYKMVFLLLIGVVLSFIIYKIAIPLYYGHEYNKGFTAFAYWFITFMVLSILLKAWWKIDLLVDNYIVVNSIVLVVLSLYIFDCIYIVTRLSEVSFGRAGFIIVPIFMFIIYLVGLLVVYILIYSQVYIYIFLIMFGSFGFFIVQEKHDYDIQQQLKYEQREVEEKAEKLEKEKKIKVNEESKKIFNRLWNHENNLSLIVEELNKMSYETEQIKEEKAVLALMLYFKDEKYKDFFEKNKPTSDYVIREVASKFVRHYELKSEEEYLKLFSILSSYNTGHTNVLRDFLKHNEEHRFSFRKLNLNNHTKMAYVVLENAVRIDSYNILELISDARFIYKDAKAREKAIKFILTKVDLSEGINFDHNSMRLLNRLIMELLSEDNFNQYIKILEEKVKTLKENNSRKKYYKDDKKAFIGMYRYLGKNHPLIEAIPRKIKEFYLKDEFPNSKEIEQNASLLLNTHWISEECQRLSFYNDSGVIIGSEYSLEIYYFSSNHKIYINQNRYKNSNCTDLYQKNSYPSFIHYKELQIDKKVIKEVHAINIEIFDKRADSFADMKSKDAFFSINRNKLCFSKSIFVKNKTVPIYTNDSTIQIGKQTLDGFAIVENENDEIDDEHCLLGID